MKKMKHTLYGCALTALLCAALLIVGCGQDDEALPTGSTAFTSSSELARATAPLAHGDSDSDDSKSVDDDSEDSESVDDDSEDSESVDDDSEDSESLDDDSEDSESVDDDSVDDDSLDDGDVLRFLSKKNDVWFPKLKPVPVMGTEKENHTLWERYYRVSDCSSSSRNNWYLGR